MKKIRVSLFYHQTRVLIFNDLIAAVEDGVYGNPMVFTAPTVDGATFLILAQEYTTKRDAYKQGGKAQKGPYQAARAAIMTALDTLAEYVDGVALGDENIILLSGFVPTKNGSSEAPDPVQATGVKITRGSTGVLLTECDNQPYGTYYGCILTAGQPLSADIYIDDNGQIRYGTTTPASNAAPSLSGIILDLNVKRSKRFVGLTPGVTYYAVYYVANAKGVSELSDPVGLLCG